MFLCECVSPVSRCLPALRCSHLCFHVQGLFSCLCHTKPNSLVYFQNFPARTSISFHYPCFPQSLTSKNISLRTKCLNIETSTLFTLNRKQSKSGCEYQFRDDDQLVFRWELVKLDPYKLSYRLVPSQHHYTMMVGFWFICSFFEYK